jgi:hypothetical protein
MAARSDPIHVLRIFPGVFAISGEFQAALSHFLPTFADRKGDLFPF